MNITEEMLYAAAPAAAERFLASLPDREGSRHEFSPAFEARMAPLLWGGRSRARLRGLLVLAAVIAALTAGLAVGAGSRSDCQLYWSQTENGLRYVIRLEHETVQPFREAEPGYVPADMERFSGGMSGEHAFRLIYRRGEEVYFTLNQERGGDMAGSLGAEYQGSEAEIGGRLGLLVESAESTHKTLLWTDGPYIFSLYAEGLDAEELLKIAGSVTW